MGFALKPDFGRTALDYARFRAGFPDELFTRLQRLAIGVAGQRVLDLGTGTGTLARAFAERGCQVTALDPSEPLMAEARRLDAEAGVSIRYVRGVAEATGLPDDGFDVVTAGVCWHWFDAERAAREVRRILAPKGRLVIAHFDWLATRGSLAEATEHLIRRYGGRALWKRLAAGIAKPAIESWKRPETGIHGDRLATLAAAGFADIESFSFDVEVPYSHEAWRGRIRTHAEVGAVQDEAQVSRLDAKLQQLLSTRFPQDPLHVLHRVFAVIGRAP